MMTLLLALTMLWPLGVAGAVVWQVYRTPAVTRRYFPLLWLSAAWPAVLLAFAGEAQWSVDVWMLGDNGS